MTDVVALDPAACAESQFLEQLRRRVSWQAEQAARQRTDAVADYVVHDPLDPVALAALIETRPDDVRAPERRAFLAELDVLIEEDGRLPVTVEGLVRLVFSDLL
jgi:hypothetical protein